MAMKLLALDDQFIAGLPPHHKEDDLISLDIIQDAEVSDAQFKLGQRVGAQPLDRLRCGCWLVEEAGLDGRFEHALFSDRERPQLRFGGRGDRDLERHRRPPSDTCRQSSDCDGKQLLAEAVAAAISLPYLPE
jgi:hypothetical protein